MNKYPFTLILVSSVVFEIYFPTNDIFWITRKCIQFLWIFELTFGIFQWPLTFKAFYGGILFKTFYDTILKSRIKKTNGISLLVISSRLKVSYFANYYKFVTIEGQIAKFTTIP